MLKQLGKIVWNALALVFVVVIVYLAIKAVLVKQEPAPSVDRRGAVLGRIAHVNKQIFVEHYNAVDVHYSEAPVEWLKGLLKQEFVVLIRGNVPAGFDLRRLSANDVWISPDGKRLQVTLPAPQIFEDNVAIDFQNSYMLYKRDTCPWFACKDSLVAYQNVILPEGKDYLIQFSLQNGILEQAARDGQAYYREFLKAMPFDEVRVEVTGYESSLSLSHLFDQVAGRWYTDRRSLLQERKLTDEMPRMRN